MRSNVLPLLAVAGLLLSGCTSPDAEPVLGRSGLVRHIIAEIDEDRLEAAERAGSVAAAMGTFATVWYEYTHQGDDADPKTLTFHYPQATGVPGSAKLSEFTTKSVLRDGDRIKIQPAPAAGVFGAVKVVDAKGSVLSARSGNTADWFTAANYPLPIAASSEGTTTWTMDASGSFSAEVQDMELPPTSSYECDRYDCHEVEQPGGHIHFASFDMGMEAESTLDVHADSDKVSFEAKFGLAYDIMLAVDMETPDMAIDGTLDGDIQADFDGALDLEFGSGGEISDVGYRAHVKVDGNIDNQGFPGVPVPQQHPWFEETVPRETHRMNLGSLAPEKAVYEFLMAAFAMDVAEGDEIRLEVHSPASPDGTMVELDYVSQVLGVEDRTVGGERRPSFKVMDTLGIQVMEGAEMVKEHKIELVYWVDAVTYLPVYAQSKVQQTLDGAALEDSLSFLRNAEGIDLPEIPAGARVVFTIEGTQRMTAYGGGFQTAALVGVGAARLVPMLGAIGLAN